MKIDIEHIGLPEPRSRTLAHVIAQATNPCILSLFVIFAILLTNLSDVLAVTGWVFIVLFFLVVMPLVLIFLKTKFKGAVRNFPGDPTTYLKRHPKDILVLGVFCGISSLALLWYAGAPVDVLFTLTSLLLTAIVIAVINLYYRASFHVAATTVLIISMGIIWGPVFLVASFFIPVIGWAKYKLGEHNLAQMAIAILLAVAIVAFVRYFILVFAG